jgi:hypothetical protein
LSSFPVPSLRSCDRDPAPEQTEPKKNRGNRKQSSRRTRTRTSTSTGLAQMHRRSTKTKTEKFHVHVAPDSRDRNKLQVTASLPILVYRTGFPALPLRGILAFHKRVQAQAPGPRFCGSIEGRGSGKSQRYDGSTRTCVNVSWGRCARVDARRLLVYRGGCGRNGAERGREMTLDKLNPNLPKSNTQIRKTGDATPTRRPSDKRGSKLRRRTGTLRLRFTVQLLHDYSTITGSLGDRDTTRSQNTKPETWSQGERWRQAETTHGA